MHAGKFFGENLTHDHMLVRRLVLIDLHPGQILVEPNQPPAEHRMVAGILSIPLLPGYCGALRQPIPETGHVPLTHNIDGHIVQTVFSQHFEEVARTEYSSIQMVLVLFNDFLAERLHHARPHFLRNTHRQGENIASEVSEGTAVRLIEGMEESVADAVGHLRVCFFILHFT